MLKLLSQVPYKIGCNSNRSEFLAVEALYIVYFEQKKTCFDKKNKFKIINTGIFSLLLI
jgi:hypothetical protein